MSVYARGPLVNVNVSCTVYYYRISRNKKGWTNPLMVRGCCSFEVDELGHDAAPGARFGGIFERIEHRDEHVDDFDEIWTLLYLWVPHFDEQV